MKKKYSAVDLTDLAIGILILGIVVTIGSRILILYRDSQLTGLDVVTTANETGIVMNSSEGVDTLVHTWGASVNACYANATGSETFGAILPNATIESANYTVTIGNVGGEINIINATATPNIDAQCTYSWYNTSREDWSLPNSAATGIAEFGNWFDIIIIVGIAGLILALIFLAFGNRGGGEASQVY